MAGRWISAKFADVSANAYAADAGAIWKATPNIQTALVVANAGTKLKFLNQEDSLPLTVRCGAAYLIGWGIFFLYYVSVARRTAALREDVERLKNSLNRGK